MLIFDFIYWASIKLMCTAGGHYFGVWMFNNMIPIDVSFVQPKW